MDMGQIAMVMGVFLLAGAVKGVTGMGLPTVAMSLLGLWMTPVQAAAWLVLPALATNLAQCRGPHLRSLAARLWPGWLAIAGVTVWGPGFGDPTAADSAGAWLGWVLVVYGVLGLWRPVLPDLSSRGPWLGAWAGGVTGLVTAFTSVFVLPWVPYLQTLRLGKDEMVQALGLSFTVAALALGARVQAVTPLQAWSVPGAVITGLALAAAFAGMALGAALRQRLAGVAFQRTLFGVFIALGAANLLRAG